MRMARHIWPAWPAIASLAAQRETITPPVGHTRASRAFTTPIQLQGKQMGPIIITQWPIQAHRGCRIIQIHRHRRRRRRRLQLQYPIMQILQTTTAQLQLQHQLHYTNNNRQQLQCNTLTKIQ